MNGRRQNCYDAFEFNDDSDDNDNNSPASSTTAGLRNQQTTHSTGITVTVSSTTSTNQGTTCTVNSTESGSQSHSGGAIAMVTSTGTAAVASVSTDNHHNVTIIPQVKVEPVETTTSHKEGFSSCDLCGSLGIRDAFYSKEKRFCSVACWRSFNVANKTGKRYTKKRKKSSSETADEPVVSLPPIPPMTAAIPLEHITSVPGDHLARVPFKWASYLDETQSTGAPVTSFKHIPLKCYWKSLTAGVKVEVKNTDSAGVQPDTYWIASVVKIAGYLTLLRYEGFGEKCSHDFWVNICSSDVHYVGWCATKRHRLVPPKLIQNDVVDWEAYLINTLIGAKTIPQNFHEKVTESLQHSLFNINDKLELLDKKRIASMRVGRVEERVGGRLCIQYLNSEGDDFWCHQLSPLIHPVGWSMVVGHNLIAAQEYRQTSLRKGVQKMTSEGEVPWSAFQPYQAVSDDGVKQSEWLIGMKLEAIDPLNLSSVCVATVRKVLSHNFLMIGIDGADMGYGSDWFCYHSNSPCVFPAGFCQLNEIALSPPKGHDGDFSWMEYLNTTQSSAAPVHLFNMDIPNHGFKQGMKLEAVDLMEPKMVCVATVARVVGRLLRIHFDGWDALYDQWIDCNSPDLFPIGWCQLMEYTLEPPGRRLTETAASVTDTKAQKRKRSTGFLKPRKKKKMRKSSVPEINLTLEFCNTTPSSSSPEPSPLSPDPPTPDPVPQQLSKPTRPLTVEELFKSHEQSKIPVHTTPVSVGGLFTTVGPQLTTTPTPVEEKTSVNCKKVDYKTVEVKHWSTDDVLQFLTDIGCEPQVEIFRRNLIDGQRLDGMSKEQISSLTGMRVGPSLKIYDYIQAMKSKH